MIAANVRKIQAMRLRFRSDVGLIATAVDRIMGLVEQSECMLGQEIEVALALREALDNAIVHGNHMDSDKWVHVQCRCDGISGVSIVVRDEGPGFDPRTVPEAAPGESHQSVQGDGLLIMRSFMDEVSFDRGGTEVHLWKAPSVAREWRSRHLKGHLRWEPHAPSIEPDSIVEEIEVSRGAPRHADDVSSRTFAHPSYRDRRIHP